MKSARALVLFAVVVSGCASLAPPAPKYGVNNALVGIESKTIYSCTTNTGKQVTFGHTHAFVQGYVRGGSGLVWLKRHTPDETPGTPPTSPIPSTNTLVDGWMRVAGGETIQWGVEGATVSANEQTFFVDAWCESAADVELIAH